MAVVSDLRGNPSADLGVTVGDIVVLLLHRQQSCELPLVAEDSVPGTARSFSSNDPEAPLGARVFVVGCHLAELIADLRGNAGRDEAPRDVQRFIDQLNRDFGNVRETLNAAGPSIADALVDAVIDRFVETLTEAGAA